MEYIVDKSRWCIYCNMPDAYVYISTLLASDGIEFSKYGCYRWWRSRSWPWIRSLKNGYYIQGIYQTRNLPIIKRIEVINIDNNDVTSCLGNWN